MVEHVVPHGGENIEDTGLAPYRLKLRETWASAKGHRTLRQGWLVRLRCGMHCGYGDCAPLPEMGTESLEEAQLQLHAPLKTLVGLDPWTALARLDRWLYTPAARCAVEMAVVDLLARRADLPLARWLNQKIRDRVAVNAALGAIDDTLQSRALKALDKGFTVLKIKLGLRPLSDELQALHTLASVLPEEIVLRLDANGAWDDATARQALNSLRDLPIETLEEPLAAPHPKALQRLQRLVPWPLALDESVRAWPLNDLLEHFPVKRLVLKPMILGGLRPALQLALQARRMGMECVVTTTLDSAAGVWSALHLSAALDNGLAHGLNTSDWLAEDTGLAPIVRNGHMVINEAPGLGFVPHSDKLVFKTP